jgi:hypothetical protein
VPQCDIKRVEDVASRGHRVLPGAAGASASDPDATPPPRSYYVLNYTAALDNLTSAEPCTQQEMLQWQQELAAYNAKWVAIRKAGFECMAAEKAAHQASLPGRKGWLRKALSCGTGSCTAAVL